MHHLFYGVCYLAITICKAFEPPWGHQAEVTGYGSLALVCFVAAAHTWTHAAVAKRRQTKIAASGENADAESAGPSSAD